MMFSLSTIFLVNIFFILPKNEIIAKSECATPTIIKLIIILFNILGVLWHIIYIFIKKYFIFTLKTSTLGN